MGSRHCVLIATALIGGCASAPERADKSKAAPSEPPQETRAAISSAPQSVPPALGYGKVLYAIVFQSRWADVPSPLAVERTLDERASDVFYRDLSDAGVRSEGEVVILGRPSVLIGDSRPEWGASDFPQGRRTPLVTVDAKLISGSAAEYTVTLASKAGHFEYQGEISLRRGVVAKMRPTAGRAAPDTYVFLRFLPDR